MSDKIYMVFDVESIGLRGEGFAVGWVVVDHKGVELASGGHACEPIRAEGQEDGRAWVRKNVPDLPTHCSSTEEVRKLFWEEWKFWKAKGALLVTDCGWPVEAVFLLQCADENSDKDLPYPLIDVSSVLLASGRDPIGTFDRKANELPNHNPLCDARQSARILVGLLHGN